MHSPYCCYLQHPFTISRKYSTVLTVIQPTSWLSIPTLLLDWQLNGTYSARLALIFPYRFANGMRNTPLSFGLHLGEELFPLGFAPDISCGTLASALRRQFELPIPLTRFWLEWRDLNPRWFPDRLTVYCLDQTRLHSIIYYFIITK